MGAGPRGVWSGGRARSSPRSSVARRGGGDRTSPKNEWHPKMEVGSRASRGKRPSRRRSRFLLPLEPRPPRSERLGAFPETAATRSRAARLAACPLADRGRRRRQRGLVGGVRGSRGASAGPELTERPCGSPLGTAGGRHTVVAPLFSAETLVEGRPFSTLYWSDSPEGRNVFSVTRSRHFFHSLVFPTRDPGVAGEGSVDLSPFVKRKGS